MTAIKYPRLTANAPDGSAYWLRRRDTLGREFQVIAWTNGATRVLAICPTYEAAAAAFRLHTIDCKTLTKF